MGAHESLPAGDSLAVDVPLAGLPNDPLERIELFRTFEDGWEDGHRGISSEVADKSVELLRALNGLDVFVVPCDGSIVFRRRWRAYRHAHGRSVEISPDGTMRLSPDFAGDDRLAGVDCRLVAMAAAWLAHPTRAASPVPSDVTRTSPDQAYSNYSSVGGADT